MGLSASPVQGVQLMDHDEMLKFIWDRINDIALFYETRGVMRFQNISSLNAKLIGDASPVAGMTAWIVESKQLITYDGTSWQRVFPASPQIYTGTTTPAASLGAVGDVYFQV